MTRVFKLIGDIWTKTYLIEQNLNTIQKNVERGLTANQDLLDKILINLEDSTVSNILLITILLTF